MTAHKRVCSFYVDVDYTLAKRTSIRSLPHAILTYTRPFLRRIREKRFYSLSSVAKTPTKFISTSCNRFTTFTVMMLYTLPFVFRVVVLICTSFVSRQRYLGILPDRA